METSTATSNPTSLAINDQMQSSPSFPTSLKFLMGNVKNIVAQPLTADNHPLWRSQVLKLFRANGYHGFLDGSSSIPSDNITSATGQSVPNPAYTNWILIDQNLAAALYSVISPTILPYVLSVEHCHEIWTILDRRLQSSTRSRIIQLKHELHYLNIKDKTMAQYLLEIKTKVDSLAAAGAPIATEEIIHYTLDGLPSTYQSFKTSIRTNLQPISLDDLYTLLCSEELNLAHETTRELHSLQISGNSTALAATRGRGRGRSNISRGRNYYTNRTSSTTNRGPRQPRPAITCQICGKNGHSAVKCWHRHDDQYNTEQPTTALFTSPVPPPPSEWFLDSGASAHLTLDPSQLQSSQSYTGSTQVTIGNGQQLPIHNTGKGLLPTPQGSLQLSRLNFVPNLSFNLLSVYQLTTDNDCNITFSSHGYVIKDKTNNNILLTGPCINGLYPLRPVKNKLADTSQLALISVQTVPNLWHRRLGHPSAVTLATIEKQFPNICNKSFTANCNSCRMGKSHRLPFQKSINNSSFPFELVHSDVWGPSQITSNYGFRYYVSFIDDFSKYTWIYPLLQKSDVFYKFLEFQRMIERQFQTHIRKLRTDGGGEFINNKFKTYLTAQGILHQFTCPYTPSQNGVAERKHRHITETTRTLLLEALLPTYLWVDTLLTAVHLINRLPSPNTHNKSPYEILYQEPPDYTHLKVFGSLCYPWLKPYSNHKFSPLSHPCVFIGYAPLQKGYRCLDPKNNKVFTSRHVVFNEQIFPFCQLNTQQTSTSTQTNPIPPLLLVPANHLPPAISDNTTPPSKTTSPPQHMLPTSPTLTNQPPDNSFSHQDKSILPNVDTTNSLSHSQPITHHMATRSKTGHSKPKKIFDLSHIIHEAEPSTYNQASKSAQWRAAMSQEFQALQTQGTWDLIPPHPTQNVLGCKWTYRIKLKSDGTVARYKARLVAKGFNQQHGIDYTETFSPVAKIPTVRIFILIALHFKWDIHQLDVSNAFLHGKLSETVYMQQPPGFQDVVHPTFVCKLNKALYGLKQSPREWYATLSNHLQLFGFSISNADPSLFIYKSGSTKLYILIYVDDILLTGNSKPEINRLLASLHDKFKMRNLGPLANFLGIQTSHTSYGVLLHQQQYATRILERAGMHNSKPVATPLSCKTESSTNCSSEFPNPHLYRQLIGSLQYLTLTRPDIQFAVHRLSQHMHAPLNSNFDDLKRLLRYIQGSTSTGIPLYRDDLTLHGYADADWATNTQDRKSISGYCNFLGKSLISWQAKKQSTVARSSTEAEYRALASEASEVIWLRRLLEDFHIPQKSPTIIYCDNTSAIALANNPVYHARTKHIDVDCHFIRDCIRSNHLAVHHICTNDQIADVFTKPLPIRRFKFLCNKLITAPQSLVCGGL
ncbi:Retrovirus-related Pol polyprotein from transposon TNT 1-94 [Dendrobium catenatum]|uniref:Retrovirus-related Pol polyprotein from transposon TNT 1-94 n=1 Tax=Dendrobium catenatum TaxID=906689 RepID=A0A2I0WLS3_9ASPA|nr:Retrovirus-related Pol polyprotein from transposon TNT 1-94 [Dendrobium catenatum]